MGKRIRMFPHGRAQRDIEDAYRLHVACNLIDHNGLYTVRKLLCKRLMPSRNGRGSRPDSMTQVSGNNGFPASPSRPEKRTESAARPAGIGNRSASGPCHFMPSHRPPRKVCVLPVALYMVEIGGGFAYDGAIFRRIDADTVDIFVFRSLIDNAKTPRKEGED